VNDPCLAALSDDQLRALVGGELGAPAVRELAKRGLISTPDTIAELKLSRKKYKRLACCTDHGWGFSGRRQFSR
jgi:hypothetical protein